MPMKNPRPKCIYDSRKLLTPVQEQVFRNFPESEGSRYFWKSIKMV